MTAPTLRALGALLDEASDVGPYPRLPPSFPLGEPVTLPEYRVCGWYAARFLDDDPDGTGRPTHRIVGQDGQVWEGSDCRPGWVTL